MRFPTNMKQGRKNREITHSHCDTEAHAGEYTTEEAPEEEKEAVQVFFPLS